jgi:Amt family ammonium transporter
MRARCGFRIGVGAGWLLAGVGTLVILKLVGAITPLRVTEEEEITGLDVALHGEVAYNLLGPGMTSGTGAPALHESSFSHSAGSRESSPEN